MVINCQPLLWLYALLPLCLLTGCSEEKRTHPTHQQVPTAGPILSKEHDGALHFDERYLDSQDVHPQNARIQRQWAIHTQLDRLYLARQAERAPVHYPRPTPSSDSVFERINGGSLKGYANQQALFADIYHRIDSLKRLERLPVTPH